MDQSVLKVVTKEKLVKNISRNTQGIAPQSLEISLNYPCISVPDIYGQI
jgi:hypothetical protein